MGANVSSHSLGNCLSPRFDTEQAICSIEKHCKTLTRGGELVTLTIPPDELAASQKFNAMQQLMPPAKPVDELGVRALRPFGHIENNCEGRTFLFDRRIQ